MRYTLLFVFLILSGNLKALSAPDECQYKQGYVPHKEINGEDIKDFVWNERISKRSDENITTLNIIFKNGDLATIEHKYCEMYNFTVSYFAADRKSFKSKESAASLVAKYFKTYSMKNIEFTPSIEKVITDGLENYKTSGNENVEISLDTIPFDSGFTYRRLINFYIGIGGQD